MNMHILYAMYFHAYSIIFISLYMYIQQYQEKKDKLQSSITRKKVGNEMYTYQFSRLGIQVSHVLCVGIYVVYGGRGWGSCLCYWVGFLSCSFYTLYASVLHTVVQRTMGPGREVHVNTLFTIFWPLTDKLIDRLIA